MTVKTAKKRFIESGPEQRDNISGLRIFHGEDLGIHHFIVFLII
jgi:hypothetical protein